MNEEGKIKTNCDVPALWIIHKQALFAFIMKRVHDRDIANDILQEVLMKVYKFCITKSGVNNVRSWLFQIAQNSIADFQRRQNRITNVLPEIEYNIEATEIEAAELIKPMIRFLPLEYAEPLWLSDIEEMKQADIAEKLGLTLSATKSRVQRARQLLKKEFLVCCKFETDRFGNFIYFEVKDTCEPLQKIIRKKEANAASF
jgi:RNA polymerase sigma-70 factor, ECF subfamily